MCFNNNNKPVWGNLIGTLNIRHFKFYSTDERNSILVDILHTTISKSC